MEKSSFDREPMWKMNRPVDEPLTKRERFAMAAMQGILSNLNLGEAMQKNVRDQVVSDSLYISDALLKELEGTNG